MITPIELSQLLADSRNANHTTQQEINQRIESLQALKADGHSFSQLVKLAVEAWKVSERTAIRYLERIQREERQHSQLPFEEQERLIQSRFERLYVKVMSKSDIAEARKVITELGRFLLMSRKIKEHKPRRTNDDSSSPDISSKNTLLERLLQDLEEEQA